jgi:hypothetical protein
VHGDPVNATDPTGWESLAALGARLGAFTAQVKMQAGAAFAAGGTAIGTFFNSMGTATQRLAETVLNSFPRLQVLAQQPFGNRVIDYTLQSGTRVAHLEVKYRIPVSSGPALDRLVAQIQAIAASGQGQIVVWSARAPSVASLNRLQERLGQPLYSQVQIVDGLWGLQQWIKLYFGF